MCQLRLQNPNAVTLAELPEVGAAIAEAVRRTGVLPDRVLCIDNGGRLLGIEVAARLDRPCSGVIAAREGGRLKRWLAPLASMLPSRLAHEWRRLELWSGIHRRRPGRRVAFVESLAELPRTVLVVDDAVDTGCTLKEVVDFLVARGVERSDIKTAAITQTSPDPSQVPDFVLSSGLLTFPWSAGSPDHSAWQAVMRTLDLPGSSS
jgi:hypoxanthine phosphoribosyltransferase